MKLGLLLLFVCCCTAFAQFGALTDQPFVAGDSSVDQLLSFSIGYHWDYTNLSDGAVSDWIDSASGYHWTQASGASQPTKDSNGVTFAGSHWLDASNTIRCSTAPDNLDVFLVVLKVDTFPGGTILASGNQVDLGFDSSQWYNPAGYWGTIVTGVWIDYVYAGTTVITPYHYTNGVVAKVSDVLHSHTLSYVGRITAGTGAYFNGKVKEVIIWTNVTGFTTNQVANIHQYVTNKYGFAP